MAHAFYCAGYDPNDEELKALAVVGDREPVVAGDIDHKVPRPESELEQLLRECDIGITLSVPKK